MPLELSHLMQLALGQITSLTVGDLPRPVAEYLKCHPAIVFIGNKEFFKIRKRHPNIEVAEFQHLTLAVRNGLYLTDSSRPNCVTLIYRNPDNGKLYQVGLKSALQGGEVWVATYHRTNPGNAKQRMNQSDVLCGGLPAK